MLFFCFQILEGLELDKELEGFLTEEWLAIPLETIHKLYESIPWRIEAVIASKDGPTPY